MPLTHDPDLLELNQRLSEAEREADALREESRKLLSKATDLRISIDSARQCLKDFDSKAVMS